MQHNTAKLKIERGTTNTVSKKSLSANVNRITSGLAADLKCACNREDIKPSQF